MKAYLFYSAGTTEALRYANRKLEQRGIPFANSPGSNVTHLLLDVPVRSSCEEILSLLSSSVTVIGGNLTKFDFGKYSCIDLLQDHGYLAENADITAHCAVKVALQKLPVTVKGCHILVIGWGRIGKCLADLLNKMGGRVTVAARKEADRAILNALGYETVDASALGYELARYRVIFNTAPEIVLSEEASGYCHADCLKIDLASSKGIEGDNVIWARGLPGTEAPETSGGLIARTILRKLQEKE